MVRPPTLPMPVNGMRCNHWYIEGVYQESVMIMIMVMVMKIVITINYERLTLVFIYNYPDQNRLEVVQKKLKM